MHPVDLLEQLKANANTRKQKNLDLIHAVCREQYERRQGYIPGSAHIIMREIPYRLDELDRRADIVVYCAHGNRSYGVAGYLIERGFRARSLKGGIAGWQARGGEVTRDARP